MSSNLGVGKTLELLERLKGAVREFAARAEKLNAEFHARTGREQRLREAAADKQAKELAAAIGEAEAAFAAAWKAAEAKHEARKARIGKAYQASKEQGLGNIENQTGTRKYELQKRMLQAERDRDAGLTAAAAALEEFKANLAAEQAALTPLETAAHRAFKGYRKFVRLLSDAYQKAAAPGAALDENQLLAELRELLSKTRGDLERFRKFWLLRVFKYLPVWVLIVLCEIPLVLQQTGLNSAGYWKAGLVRGREPGRRPDSPFPRPEPGGAARGGHCRRAREGAAAARHARERSEAHYQQELERIKGEFESTTRTVDQQLKQALAEAGERRVGCRMAERREGVPGSGEERPAAPGEAGPTPAATLGDVEQLKRTAETRRKAEVEASEKREAKLNTDYQAQWQTLEADWKKAIQPIYEGIQSANDHGGEAVPSLGAAQCWRPGLRPPNLRRPPNSPRWHVDVEKLAETTIKDKRLALPGPARFSVPLCLAYPEQGSILFETARPGARRGHRRAQQHHPAAALDRAAGPAELHHH